MKTLGRFFLYIRDGIRDINNSNKYKGYNVWGYLRVDMNSIRESE